MFGSWILDVAIGLIVVYILFATICTTVREGVEAWLKTRAAYLERSIRELLNDDDGTGISRDLYQHPLIFSLFSGKYHPAPQRQQPGMFDRGANLPSYIPSQNFALALLDVVARGPSVRTPQEQAARGSAPVAPASSQLDLASVRSGLVQLQTTNEPVARLLANALDTAQGDLEQARRNLEDSFDSMMERVSGWYRRKTNLFVFAMALALALGFNINTFAIVDGLIAQTDRHASIELARKMLEEHSAQASLYRTDIVTEQAAALMQAPPGALSDPAAKGATGAGALSIARLTGPELQLPIGWSTDRREFADWRPWPLMIAGWIVTALAATMGTPFWFDILNKVMIVRSTVKPDDKDGKKAAQEPAKRSLPQPAASTGSGSRPMAWTPAPPTLERRQTPQIPFDAAAATTDIDGCGHADAPQTEDKDLPPAQGGMQ